MPSSTAPICRWRGCTGADMSGAKLQGSDMRGAVVWRTLPPGGEAPAVADMAQIVLQPPSDDELVGARCVAGAAARTARSRRGSPTAWLRLSDAAQNSAWGASTDQQAWQGLAKASETLPMPTATRGALTEYLARFMCRPRFANGAVAAGVARRAMAPGFQGDMPALYVGSRAPTAPPPPP